MNNIIVYKDYYAITENVSKTLSFDLCVSRFRVSNIHEASSASNVARESGITLFDPADIYGSDKGEPFGTAAALGAPLP